ncbi:MAG: permease-like cell division protein FtsX [Melioribacteraceae bacterium]
MILFYFAEAFRLFKRTPLGSVVTILTVAAAISLTSMSALLIYFSNSLQYSVKNQVELSIFLKPGLTKSEIESARDEISQFKLVKKITFIDSEEAKKIFIKETGEDFTSVLESNPLPNSFNVLVKPEFGSKADLDKLTAAVKGIKEVDEVIFDYDTVSKILSVLGSAQNIIYIVSFIFVILSVYLVYSNCLLHINSRNEIYDIMKLIGSKLSSIKMPIIINAIVIGVISSLLVIATIFILNLLLTNFYSSFKFDKILYFLYPLVLFLGILYSLIGSILSTKDISLKLNN